MHTPPCLEAISLTDYVPQEHGVDTAIQCIYRDLQYATDLVEAKAKRNGFISDNEDVEDEDEWTIIGDVDHDVPSDNELAESSLSRQLPSQSVIWSSDVRSGSIKNSNAGSGNDRLLTKEPGR